MIDLAKMVKEHRRLAGLTQSDLAKLSGVGKTVVFDIEHGKQSIQFNTLVKVLGTLNIKIDFKSPFIKEEQER